MCLCCIDDKMCVPLKVRYEFWWMSVCTVCECVVYCINDAIYGFDDGVWIGYIAGGV